MTLDSQLQIIIFPPVKSFNADRESIIAQRIADGLCQIVARYKISDVLVRVARDTDFVPEERTCINHDYVAAAIMSNYFCAGACEVTDDDDSFENAGLQIMGIWQRIQNGEIVARAPEPAKFDDSDFKKLLDAAQALREQQAKEEELGDDLTSSY